MPASDPSPPSSGADRRGAPAAPATPQPALPPWPTVSGRQKLWLALLTVATVAALTYVLQRPHQHLVAEKSARHAEACQGPAASRPADCPGARMPVLVLPAAPAASR